jgi:hypothetical protein
MEITRSEAEAMIRLVIPGPEASFIPYGMDGTGKKDFPILGSGGWRIELVVRSRWCLTLTIAAFLRGPEYRDDLGEEPGGVIFTAAAAKLDPWLAGRA